MSGKTPFEGKKQPFLRVLGKFLVSEFSVKNKSDIAKHKKKPRKPTFSGLFWRREQDLSRGEASGERSNTVAKRCVAKRYVISLSCSRSIEKGLPLQAFVWRREQDLNLRRLLTSHAFQACALNRSTISPSVFLEVKKELSHHFSYLPK